MATWLALSFVAYVIAAWGASRLPPFTAQSRYVRALNACARGAYFVGPLYLALISGLTTLSAYAIPTSWSQGLEPGLRWSLGVFLLVSLALWLHKRFVFARYPPSIFPAVARRAQLSQPWGAAFVLRDTLYLQAHWTFYRAAALSLFDDDLTAAVAGAGLVMVEWLLNPSWRQHIRQPGRAEDLALTFVLLCLNVTLFIYTRNLWLMLMAHAVLWLGWLGLLAHWYQPLSRNVEK